jgi:hypothetical protein
MKYLRTYNEAVAPTFRASSFMEMKEHIRVEYDYLDDGQRERQFIEKVKQECENFSEMIKQIKKEFKK